MGRKYEVGYIGTYYSDKSRGVYRFLFDAAQGRMTEPELFYEARAAKWVSLSGSTMIFPTEKEGRAGICVLTLKEDGPHYAAEILEEEKSPCYILQEGGFVYTANYYEGNAMVYRLEGGIPSLVKRIEHGSGAGCHQILLHEALLMVPCLEQDRITLFDTRHGYAPAGEIVFPEGSGPRHGVFNREHTKLYVVSERSNELFVFRVQGREFHLLQSLSLLPGGSAGEAAAAAIRLTADECFLYVSVRGINGMTVLDVRGGTAAVIQHISCGGDHPRDFILSGDERYILIANRFAGGIVCMERDKSNGLLMAAQHHAAMPEGVALVFAG